MGVGIDNRYDGYDQLAHAVAEAREVAEVLAADFTGEPIFDVDQAY